MELGKFMTRDEFISSIKSKGALMWGPASIRSIGFANTNLQMRKCAMLPAFMIDLYETTAGINLGTGYIFGPSELPNKNNFPIPDIVQINEDVRHLSMGKTIFGRNDLFWFAFDAFGTCYMLDNLTLKPLRKYDDAFKALYDCLMGGKI